MLTIYNYCVNEERESDLVNKNNNYFTYKVTPYCFIPSHLSTFKHFTRYI